MGHAEANRAPTSSLTLVAGIALLVGLVVFGWAAPATFNVYKMVHVVAAVVWVGGGAMLTVLALPTEREGDPTGLIFLSPQTKKVNVMAAEHGAEHQLTQAAVKKLLLVARFDVAVLLLVVADMAAKPFS